MREGEAKNAPVQGSGFPFGSLFRRDPRHVDPEQLTFRAERTRPNYGRLGNRLLGLYASRAALARMDFPDANVVGLGVFKRPTGFINIGEQSFSGIVRAACAIKAMSWACHFCLGFLLHQAVEAVPLPAARRGQRLLSAGVAFVS